ncbi:MAG TPA: branched-chain amino acid ABC transporter permease [Oribacterium sp.]|jgi:predicted branched-subunit amino acid permease|nr:branched-chain amino acid ABC transporter permease [Oribacterium sp.]
MGNISANNAGGPCAAEDKYSESLSVSCGSQNRQWFIKGLYDGIPIAAGYFAVSFALGIAAKTAGLNAFQATLTSFLCNASAGEYAGFTVIASNAAYVEMAVISLIVNARYLLMSAALSQKFSSSTPFYHRLLVSFCVTDEIFGASVTVPGKLNPFYNYGLAVNALGFWAFGTCLGVIMGNVLPANVVSALGVLLYGMFLAIIMPPARRNTVVRVLVLLSMALSFACSKLPLVSSLSSGTRIILLTVLLSGAAAVFCPISEEQENSTDTKEKTIKKEDPNHV